MKEELKEKLKKSLLPIVLSTLVGVTAGTIGERALRNYLENTSSQTEMYDLDINRDGKIDYRLLATKKPENVGGETKIYIKEVINDNGCKNYYVRLEDFLRDK